MKTILILLAHNDDEYFITQKIKEEASLGNRLVFLYTTYGSPSGVDPQIRVKESQLVLQKFGIPKEDIVSIGLKVKNFDGDTHQNMNKIYDQILKEISSTKIDEIVTLAWEGGHHDHDATHLMAKALAVKLCIEDKFYEFSAYNGFKLSGPFFNIGRFIPATSSPVNNPLKLAEILLFLPLFLFYKSQRKTFFFLFPLIFYRMAIKRSQPLRVVPKFDYAIPPHHNKLYYERRFNVPFDNFIKNTENFRAQFL